MDQKEKEKKKEEEEEKEKEKNKNTISSFWINNYKHLPICNVEPKKEDIANSGCQAVVNTISNESPLTLPALNGPVSKAIIKNNIDLGEDEEEKNENLRIKKGQTKYLDMLKDAKQNDILPVYYKYLNN